MAFFLFSVRVLEIQYQFGFVLIQVVDSLSLVHLCQ